VYFNICCKQQLSERENSFAQQRVCYKLKTIILDFALGFIKATKFYSLFRIG
jgi:hypothetical protein